MSNWPDGDLYVRAYNGTDSGWYRAALRRKAGRITAAGTTKRTGPSTTTARTSPR